MLKKTARSGTFTDNMKLPVHRWFRYSAGFSAEWVLSEIERYQSDTGEDAVLLEPFTGSGTTNIAADALGVRRDGCFDQISFGKIIAVFRLCGHWNDPAACRCDERVIVGVKRFCDEIGRAHV